MNMMGKRAPGGNNLPDSNQKRSIKILRPLVKYALKYKWKLLLVALLVLASNLLLLAIPALSGEVIDAIGLGAGKVDFAVISRSVALIALCAAAGFLLDTRRGLIMLKTSQAIVFDLRNDVFSHLIHLPVSFFDKFSKGDLMSRISVDIDNISELISSDLIMIFTGAVTITGAFLMMFAISPFLMLVFVLTVPLLFVFARRISKKGRALHRVRKSFFGRLCAHAEEMISAQKSIKVFGLEQFNIDGFEHLSGNLAQSGEDAEFNSSKMMPVMNFINNLNFLLISAVGCALYFMGGISIGNISSFILYSKKFSAPIIDIANLFNTIQSSLAACERICTILNGEVEADEADPDFAHQIQGHVKFEHVDFSYTPGTPVIRDMSFEARPGQKIAIVGATGSGKTTLISLLLRFYRADRGRITFDGVDIGDFPLNKLRRSFALVLQDSWLFEGTIKDNIGYAADCTDDARILKALSDVQMADYVSRLPKGIYNTLSSDTSELSQGQKQLLTIARAILYDPPIIIFDEATSNVDTATEQKLKAVTNRVMQGRTSFIIAHRLSTIQEADRIIMIREGQILEQGTHQELLARRGAYYEMYQSQFEVAQTA